MEEWNTREGTWSASGLEWRLRDFHSSRDIPSHNLQFPPEVYILVTNRFHFPADGINHSAIYSHDARVFQLYHLCDRYLISTPVKMMMTLWTVMMTTSMLLSPSPPFSTMKTTCSHHHTRLFSVNISPSITFQKSRFDDWSRGDCSKACHYRSVN